MPPPDYQPAPRPQPAAFPNRDKHWHSPPGSDHEQEGTASRRERRRNRSRKTHSRSASPPRTRHRSAPQAGSTTDPAELESAGLRGSPGWPSAADPGNLDQRSSKRSRREPSPTAPPPPTTTVIRNLYTKKGMPGLSGQRGVSSRFRVGWAPYREASSRLLTPSPPRRAPRSSSASADARPAASVALAPPPQSPAPRVVPPPPCFGRHGPAGTGGWKWRVLAPRRWWIPLIYLLSPPPTSPS